MKIRMAIVCAVIVLGSWMGGVSAAVSRFGAMNVVGSFPKGVNEK